MQSQEMFQRAGKVIPGGVNSPVRAFAAVGGTPVFIDRAQGAKLYAVDGTSYIDYVGSWGPAILGHAAAEVIEAVTATARNGLGFGTPCPLEVDFAEQLQAMLPWVEKLRVVNSGTEATMSAIRLARGYTGRTKLIKFAGCYHGHADCLLVKAGSGSLTLGQPDSAGVPAATVSDTIVLPFNSIESLDQAFADYAEEIATVIIEPIAGNMNLVPAKPEFLQRLKELCDQHGSVLIFDEVMTGFRVAAGGAVALYGIQPDLVCYGKIVGGGMPVGVFAGRDEIMNHIAPTGTVYQAGTLSGNPVAMAAGLATLKSLAADEDLHSRLADRLEHMLSTIQQHAASLDIGFRYVVRGAMFGYFFTDADGPIETFEQVKDCNIERFKTFFHAMLERGIYLAPSAFEAGFISRQHGDEEIEQTILAARNSLTTIRN